MSVLLKYFLADDHQILTFVIFFSIFIGIIMCFYEISTEIQDLCGYEAWKFSQLVQSLQIFLLNIFCYWPVKWLWSDKYETVDRGSEAADIQCPAAFCSVCSINNITVNDPVTAGVCLQTLLSSNHMVTGLGLVSHVDRAHLISCSLLQCLTATETLRHRCCSVS